MSEKGRRLEKFALRSPPNVSARIFSTASNKKGTAGADTCSNMDVKLKDVEKGNGVNKNAVAILKKRPCRS